MYNFEKYTANKNELLAKMDAVKFKIMDLDSLGIDVSESVKKIEAAKTIVQNDKISVVLVGAFSDGKTSVAAGWLNEKLDNMKIDSDESSDEILCYTPSSIPEGCQIVDTPGLFGDKVGSDENGGRITLSEKTKKYISEANMILYVVPAKNPIKDSHKECIRWILKDLNKLSTTVFVINRMDDVADMTDDKDYEVQARIKSENLRGKLLDCGISYADAQAVKIACISAAPDGKGVEVWKEYREEYLQRSRLPILESVTNEILQNSRQHLLTKTGCDILNDEIKKMLDVIREKTTDLSSKLLPEQKETLERNEKDLAKLRKRLLQSRGEIKDELRSLEKRKLACIRAATMENFRDVMEDEIGILPGQEGYRLENEINCVFDRYCIKYSGWTGQVGDSMQAEYEKQNELLQSLLSKGKDALSTGLKSAKNIGVDAIKSGIFKGRDLLGKMGKTVKFKPWQVTKMANFATNALPFVGVGIDVVSDIVANSKERKRNKEFEANKDEVKDELLKLFKGLNDELSNDNKYLSDFAPDYGVLVEQIKNDKEIIQAQERLLKDFEAWEKTVSEDDYTFC
jgi:GTPase Era involved in 16S rRNA processing/RNA polymerase-binding transcription factor DksA